MSDYFNFSPDDPDRVPAFARARDVTLNRLFQQVADAFDRLPNAAALFASSGFAIDTGAANALLITHPFDGFTYAAGREITVLVAQTSTGAATINVTPLGGAALGPKAIVQPDGQPLITGQLRAGAIVKLAYDGAEFVAIGGLWADPVNAAALLALATALMAANVLPSQTGQSGRLLTTNGTVPSWVTGYHPIDPAAGNTGKLLRSDGTDWSAEDQYPAAALNAFLRSVAGGGVAWEQPVDVQVFTASGTWTKPNGARVVTVEMYGAGGGGGSGNKHGTTTYGGGGGGGGSRTCIALRASDFGATETVVVGAGGAAGAGVLIVGNGTDGSDGGSSSFGAGIAAYGGKGGKGGAGGGSLGGRGADSLGRSPSDSGYNVTAPGDGTLVPTSGNSGGTGASGVDAGPAIVAGWSETGGGGGGSGGVATSLPNGVPGGFSRLAPGGAGGTVGSPGGATGGFRQGGGGGYGPITGAGGVGGAGGIASGGGGGGSTADVGAGLASGAGGAGGAGYCRVTTW